MAIKASKQEMSPRSLIVLATSLGLLAIVLSIFYLQAKERQLREELAPEQVEMVDVLVANRDLLQGTELDGSVLSIRSVPKTFVHNQAVKPREFESIAGLVLVQPMEAGTTLLSSFIEANYPFDFSDTIPVKRRAVTIQVDQVNSVGGFIRPGNRIDILVYATSEVNVPEVSIRDDRELRRRAEFEAVVPVLENVEVLATGQEAVHDYEEKIRLLKAGFGDEPDRYSHITVNVTPREAALLLVAKQRGELVTLLRNRKDTGGSQFRALASDEIIKQAANLSAESGVRIRASLIEGVHRDSNDVLQTRLGLPLANQDLLLLEDGKLMTKQGVVLNGRGLTVDPKGRLVTLGGILVEPDKLIVTQEGAVMSRDGKLVLPGGFPLSVSKGNYVKFAGPVVDGKVLQGVIEQGNKTLMVLADHTVLSASEVSFDSQGRVFNSVTGERVDFVSAESPTLITEGGAILVNVPVDKDKIALKGGGVLDPNELVISTDGKLYTPDGELIEGDVGVSVTVIKDTGQGDIVATTSVGRDMLLTGAKVDSNGELMLSNGAKMNPEEIVLVADGKVRTNTGQVLEGLNWQSTLPSKTYAIEYITGGRGSASAAVETLMAAE